MFFDEITNRQVKHGAYHLEHSARLAKRTKCSKKWINVARFIIIGIILIRSVAHILVHRLLKHTNFAGNNYENRMKTMFPMCIIYRSPFVLKSYCNCHCDKAMCTHRLWIHDRLVQNGKVCVISVAQTPIEREFIDTFKSFLTSQNDPCRCLFCFWHHSHCAKYHFNVWHTRYDTQVLNVHWVPLYIGFMCACYLTEKFEQIFRGFLEFTKSLLRIRLKIAVNAFLMAYYCPA